MRWLLLLLVLVSASMVRGQTVSACRQNTNLSCLAGRTGSTNDPKISSDNDGSIYGSAASGHTLLLRSNSVNGSSAITMSVNSIDLTADAAGFVNILRSGGSSAGILRFWNAAQTGTTSLASAAAPTGNTDYILPSAAPLSNGDVLSSTTGGTMSWVTRGSGTVTSVAATAPAAGFTISGSPITTSGTLTFTLANDLSALESLGSTGFAARTATDTWAQRTITAGVYHTITNGDGVSGNPTVALSGAPLAALHALAGGM